MPLPPHPQSSCPWAFKGMAEISWQGLGGVARGWASGWILYIYRVSGTCHREAQSDLAFLPEPQGSDGRCARSLALQVLLTSRVLPTPDEGRAPSLLP